MERRGDECGHVRRPTLAKHRLFVVDFDRRGEDVFESRFVANVKRFTQHSIAAHRVAGNAESACDVRLDFVVRDSHRSADVGDFEHRRLRKSRQARGLSGNGFFSISEILSTRRACRPPLKFVSIQMLTMWSTIRSPSRSAERQRTLASLWLRESSAVTSSWTAVARIPGILLAAIDIPNPVPHTRIPRSASPLATVLATEAAMSG